MSEPLWNVFGMGFGRSRKVLWVTFDTRVNLEFHGAKVVEHARYVVLQMAEVEVPRKLFAAILERIRRLRGPQVARCLPDEPTLTFLMMIRWDALRRGTRHWLVRGAVEAYHVCNRSVTGPVSPGALRKSQKGVGAMEAGAV